MSDGARKSTSSSGDAVASANKGEKEKATNRGEKEKAPRRQPSNRSASRGGGSVRGESSASGDGEGEIYADDNFNYPSNRLGRLCENVGKARGLGVCTYCMGVCCARSD